MRNDKELKSLKRIFEIEIPYWAGKRLAIRFIKLSKGDKKRIQLTLIWLKKVVDYEPYGGFWGFQKIKHWTLWKNYNNFFTKMVDFFQN